VGKTGTVLPVSLVLVAKSGQHLLSHAVAHQVFNGMETTVSLLALQAKSQSMAFVNALLEPIY
jgi:hypothetical protein